MTYWQQKIFRIFITLFVVLTLNFVLPRLMPGDPLILQFGPDASVASQSDLTALNRQYGLDQPLHIQYVAYWKSLAAGDLGYSFHLRREVLPLIMERLGWTLLLLMPALLFSSLLVIVFGAWSGWRSGSGTDFTITLGALLLASCPPFLLAMLAIRWLAFQWQFFPLAGISSGDSLSATSYAFDVLWHICLPALVLALSAAAGKIMIMRSGVMASRYEPYVVYARIKGLSSARILRVHVLRNACLPLVGMLGLQLGYMVSGALVIEIVFSLNGMGTLIYDAALFRDYPVLQGCFLLLALFVVTANALIDGLYRLLDPRIRL